MALTIGMRPCTGAIGVLFLANGLGLIWAGIASTFVMSIGTAITVSALATLTVAARDTATKVAGVADNRWAARAEGGLKLAGALLVFVLGVSFFWYSLSNPMPT
jgi:ABC-type nickel/cobalt efflux system permease component RcnA